MIEVNKKKRLFVVCISCSILVHLVGLIVIGQARIFEFTTPVTMRPSIAVNLVEANDGIRLEERRKSFVREPVGTAGSNGSSPGDSGAAGSQSSEKHPTSTIANTGILPKSEPVTLPEVMGTVPAMAEKGTTALNSEPTEAPTPSGPVVATSRAAKLRLEQPLRKGSEFLTVAHEKLTYRIDMFGLPVGEAVLEAVNSKSGITITTRVTSNAVIASVYPVDDFIETQLVCGNYFVTKIRQHEGSYTRNSGFTLMLRERKAFSLERLKEGFVTDTLPREDVLDVITGFYFLRNQPVEVGKSLLLHLYDGDKYAPTVVEVLRNERIHVSGLGEVETLVIHPLLTISGYFQRTGEMLVWLTDDENKVPVRMQTSIALGKVTAELISTEVERASSPQTIH